MASDRTLKRRRQRHAARTRPPQVGFVTAGWATQEVVRILKHNLALVQLVNRQFDNTFGVEGPIIVIRTPPRTEV